MALYLSHQRTFFFTCLLHTILSPQTHHYHHPPEAATRLRVTSSRHYVPSSGLSLHPVLSFTPVSSRLLLPLPLSRPIFRVYPVCAFNARVQVLASRVPCSVLCLLNGPFASGCLLTIYLLCPCPLITCAIFPSLELQNEMVSCFLPLSFFRESGFVVACLMIYLWTASSPAFPNDLGAREPAIAQMVVYTESRSVYM